MHSKLKALQLRRMVNFFIPKFRDDDERGPGMGGHFHFDKGGPGGGGGFGLVA